MATTKSTATDLIARYNVAAKALGGQAGQTVREKAHG